MNLFWKNIKNLFAKKSPAVIEKHMINLDNETIYGEYRKLLAEMHHLLEKYNHVEESGVVTKALSELDARNAKKFIALVAGKDFWGGACSVCDFRFYFSFTKENNKEDARQDQKRGDMLLFQLSRMLRRDGVQSTRIEGLGDWHAQRAENVDSY